MGWSVFVGLSKLMVGLGLGLVLVGCASTQTLSPSEAPEMAVTKDFSPFYSRGPQQIQGPDASLRQGDRLLLLRKEFGYSYVQLADGRTGFVPNENIGTPPTPPIAANKPRPQPKKPAPPPEESSADLEEEVLPDFRIMPEEFPPAILLDETEEPAKPDFRL
jgi:hypothetical protein